MRRAVARIFGRAGAGLGLLTRRLPAGAGSRVCLTFDDGPHAGNTPRILDILSRRRARATFFLTGAECLSRSDLVRRIADEGHEIANHGFAHLAPWEATAAEHQADVERAQDVLEQILGAPVPRLFRPPYGLVDPLVFRRLTGRGFHYVLWDVDSGDEGAAGPDAILARLSGSTLRAGSIVLLHDDADHTVAALPGILDLLVDGGFELVTVGAALGVDGAPADRSRERCA